MALERSKKPLSITTTPQDQPKPSSFQQKSQEPSTPFSHFQVIEPRKSASEGNKNALVDADEVLDKYPKLLSLANIGRLSVRLATESYFGTELMKKCTVFGCNDKPSLPKEVVFEMKRKLLTLHPQFRSTPLEFEVYWAKSIAAINHCCAGLRSKQQIKID